MKSVDQWICWSESNNGEKVPVDCDQYQPWRKLYRAVDYQNQDAWYSYSKVKEAEAKEAISGIGFVLLNKNVTLIDIDNCVAPDSLEIDPEIYSLIDNINSYTELSPSNTGVHIYCRGSSPLYGWSPSDSKIDIGVFDRSWTTVTQRHINGFPKSVQGTRMALRRICEEYDIGVHGGW